MRTTIKNGDLEAFRRIVSENEGVLKEDTPFGSWLHYAAGCGKSEIVKYLIEEGLDVNGEGGLSNANPLSCAANNGHLDTIKILYENGARFNISEAKKNPLFGAISGNHLEVVRFLVENGIDVTIKYKIGKMEECDACEYARQFGRMRIVEYLEEMKQK